MEDFVFYINFNSIKVRLKHAGATNRKLGSDNFNSIKVRLKRSFIASV